MISKTEDGNYTPYVPAQKIVPSIAYTRMYSGDKSMSLFVEGEQNLAQDNIYPNELATPAYFLLNAGASMHLPGKTTYDLGLTGHNLLNEAYFDHLSRFKYYGINNIGINLTFYIKARHLVVV